MMKLLALLVLVLNALPASAKDPCAESNWTVVGNLSKAIQTYDMLFKTGAGSKTQISTFNLYLRKNGLLQVLSPVGEIKGFPNRLERDGMGGVDVGAFLKTMNVPEDSGLSLDRVYEVADVSSTKALRSWHLPYGSNGPSGLEGDDLFYDDIFQGICTKATFKSLVRVRLDNSYELVNLSLPEKIKTIPPDRCKAAKTLFKDSAYSTCGEVIDLKTRKKRILVWEFPMT